MSRRLTRQEIKKDEVRDKLATIFWWIETHYRQILMGVAGLIVLGFVGTGVYLYMEGRQDEAQEALAAALPDLPDPTNAEAPPAAGSAAQRSETAAALESLRGEFGGTDAARISGAYLGSLHAVDGEMEQARELWQEYASEGHSDALGASVMVNLWTLDRVEGRAESVATDLESRLRAESGLPKDLLLYQLALTYEDLDRAEEAGDTYQRLLDEHPASAYTIDARRQATALGLS